MKRLLTIIALISLTTAAMAQRAQEYIRQIEGSSSKVRIYLAPSVIKGLHAVSPIDKVSGFRVCVFSDNSQNARSGASAAAGTLGEVIGAGGVSMIYDNPFFRVYGGYCINKTEAAQLLGRVKGLFPKAFIVPMSFPISSLSLSRKSALEADSSALKPIVEDPVSE